MGLNFNNFKPKFLLVFSLKFDLFLGPYYIGCLELKITTKYTMVNWKKKSLINPRVYRGPNLEFRLTVDLGGPN